MWYLRKLKDFRQVEDSVFLTASWGVWVSLNKRHLFFRPTEGSSAKAKKRRVAAQIKKHPPDPEAWLVDTLMHA